MEKARLKAEEERKKLERSLRKRADNFWALLKRFEPPLSSTVTWEEILPEIQERSAFKAFDGDDTEPRQIFRDYINLISVRIIALLEVDSRRNMLDDHEIPLHFNA